MKKKVWITLLAKAEDKAQKIMSQVSTYGLEPNGHFWTDEVEKMSWLGPMDELQNSDVALWLILSSKEELAKDTVRFGLSLLSILVHAKRGNGFPIVILHGDDEKLSADDLPTPLKNAEILPASSGTLAAKLVAVANIPQKNAETEYRLDIHGIPGLGIWFEVGPVGHTWKGAMFGVSGEGADINAHGVGPGGKLPAEKMILNYPMKGLKLGLGENEYTAWALQNEIDDNSSYYLRVTGQPDSILFGPYASEDEGEVFVVKLK